MPRRTSAALLVLAMCAVGLAPTPADGEPSPVTVAGQGSGLFGWGRNDAGQLGSGDTTVRTAPVAVALPDGVALVDVSGGLTHTVALTTTGEVLAWGSNTSGELGNGTTTASTSIVTVAIPDGVTVTDVEAAFGYSLALTSDGRVLAWGRNDSGFLGDGTTANRSTPDYVHLPDGTEVTAISASQAAHALTSTGRVYGWGNNFGGEVGDGTTKNSRTTPVPVALPSATVVTAIATGSIALAVTSANELLAWGGTHSVLGTGVYDNGFDVGTPTKVRGLPTAGTIVDLAVGSHSIVLLSSGDVYAWGRNNDGQVGDGGTSTVTRPTLVQLPGDPTIVDVDASGSHSVAVGTDGTVRAWGGHTYGELGDGRPAEPGARSLTPTAVCGISVGRIEAAGSHVLAMGVRADTAPCAPTGVEATPGHASATVSWQPPAGLATVTGYTVTASTGASVDVDADTTTAVVGGLTNGVAHRFDVTAHGPGGTSPASPASHPVYPGSNQVLGWGDNTRGALGDGTTVSRLRPVAAVLPAGTDTNDIADVIAGSLHTLAVAADGRLLGWGENAAFVLGDGTNVRRPHPIVVPLPDGVAVARAAAGEQHGLALARDGRLFGWGWFGSGIGDGRTDIRRSPVEVPLPDGVVFEDIAAGGWGSVGLAEDGRLFAWGQYVGNGFVTNQTTPQAVALPADTAVTDIDLGYRHRLVATATGEVYGWGDNSAGQVGDGTTTSTHPAPVAVVLPEDASVVRVAAGKDHSLALTSDGRVLAWGENGRGQLGTGSTTDSRVPVPVALPDGTRVTAIAAGDGVSYAITADERVLAWGSNLYGQLGDGISKTVMAHPTPLVVAWPAGAVPVGISAGQVHTVAVTAGAPGAPTDVSAVPLDGAARVTWSPADGRGARIRSYVVTASDGTTATVAGDPAPLTAVVDGLANDVAQTFTVTAVSGVGAGPASEPSAPVTPHEGAADTPSEDDPTPPPTPPGGTPPALTPPTVTWSAPMATHRRALLGGTMTVTVSGGPGLTATAAVEHLSWYAGVDLLRAPAVTVARVPLIENASRPGTYTGTFPIVEGIAEITRVTATVADGSGRSASGAADRGAVPVSGALSVDVASDAALAGTRLLASSSFHVTGDQVRLTDSGTSVLRGLVPADDYVARLIEADGRLAGETTGLSVLAGRTMPAAIVHVPRSVAVVAVVDDAGRPLAGASVVFTTGDGTHVGRDVTDAGGRATGPVMDRGTTVVASSTLPWNDLPIARTASTRTALTLAGDNPVRVQHDSLAGGALSGRVLRFDGDPAVNAIVTVVQQAPDGRHLTFTARTDSAGRYALVTLTGRASVSVVHGYQTPQRFEVTVVAAGTDAGDLTLPEQYAYDVSLELSSRYLGEPLQEHPVDWSTATQFELRVKAPTGSFSPRAGTVRVVASPGDVIRFCADGARAQLPSGCDEVTAGGSPAALLHLGLQLEQEGVVDAMLATTSGAPISAWSATLWRIVDGARRPAGAAEGRSPALSVRVPTAGEYELDVDPAGHAPRTVAFSAGAAEETHLGRLTFGPAGGIFAGSGNSVTALRPATPPGGTVTFRVGYVVPAGGASDAVLHLEVPAGTSLKDRSVVRDGDLVAGGTAVTGGFELPLGDLSAGATGSVHYALQLDDVAAGGTVTVRPRMRFAAPDGAVDATIGTGSTRVTGVTVEAPRSTASRDIVLTGRAPADVELALYDGVVLVGTTTASPGGYWRQRVTLHDRGPHARHLVHAETTTGALRSPDRTVEFDADRPELIEVAVQQPGGNRVVFDPRGGVARFPYIWRPDVAMHVEARFSAPDRVRGVVARVGEATASAQRVGDVFTATVKGTGRGGIGIDFEVMPPAYGFDESPPSLEQLEDRLPAGFAGARSTLPDEGGANRPGSDRAVVVTELPEGGVLRTEMTLSDVRDYTPTAADDEVVHASGVPFFDIVLESVPTVDGGREVTFRALVPEDVLARTDVFAAAAELLATGGHDAPQPPGTFRTAAAHGTTIKKVAELAVKVAADKRTEAVFAAGTPIYDSEQSKAAGDKYAAVGQLYDDLSICPPEVQTRFRGRLDGQLSRAAGADIVGVGLAIAGAVVAPATFGLGTIVLWGIGAGAGLAIDASINGQIARLRNDLTAEGCGRNGRAGGDDLAEPVWIHDPSGYVYEAVPDNRLAGVTATVLYAEHPEGPWSVWDAEWFGQTNPLVTGVDGRYAWDVPEGFWQVVYERGGYVTGYSDVLEVLPPHFDVNEGLVSLAAPRVTAVTATPKAITITFDRHVLAASVHDEHVRVSSDGLTVPGSVSVDVEVAPDGAELTRTARFVPDVAFATGVLEVTVDQLVQSYAGRPLAADHVTSVPVTAPDRRDDDRGSVVDRWVEAGGHVSSDVRGPRPGSPTVTITTPRAGRVTIDPVRTRVAAPAGLHVLEVEAWDITAPAGAPSDPLVLTFSVARADVGAEVTRLTLLRDGRPLLACRAGATRRSLPCIAEHRMDGDVLTAVVHTDHASVWHLAALPAADAACPGRARAPFRDVPSHATHADAIACVAHWGVAGGTSPARFEPTGSLTRGQMASLLARMLLETGVELPEPSDRFVDDDGNVHERAIGQLAALGIVAGRTPTSFAPGRTVTRAQMASFLVRTRSYVVQQDAVTPPDAFVDDDGTTHEPAIDQAAALGLATGVSSRRFAPDAPVARAQAASFVYRLLADLVLNGTALPRP